MHRRSLGITACALLCAGAAYAVTTPQQKCDNARIAAWKTYQDCVRNVVIKDYGPPPPASFNDAVAFAKCRHTYFSQWGKFQKKGALATSTCIGDRLVDNGPTVTDNLTGLVWEKKTTDATIHDQGNTYTWSTGSPFAGNGTAFTGFLGTLASGFAGANDWRLPAFAELQSIVLDFPCTHASCTCPSTPCVDPTFGATQSQSYWSATGYLAASGAAWALRFLDGIGLKVTETSSGYVRAVRGGF